MEDVTDVGDAAGRFHCTDVIGNMSSRCTEVLDVNKEDVLLQLEMRNYLLLF